MKNDFSRGFAIIIVLITFSFHSCDLSKKGKKEEPVTVSQHVPVPVFNGDSAYHFVGRQVLFGPRVPNTKSHDECRNYLVSTLKSYGAVVIEQKFEETAFNGQILSLSNIIASISPGITKRILLAAHWDTRPFADKDSQDKNKPIDGANDGASGVGVLLEIARVMSKNPPAGIGVDIILFDGEDYGEPDDFEENMFGNTGRINWCLGSQYWSNNKHSRNYMAYYGILLDMVGAKSATFYQEGVSMQYAPKVVKKVWDAGSNIGFSQFFVPQTAPGITDDHVFVNRDAKIPMINIVEYKPDSKGAYFAEYHHTHNDNMEIIDPVTLKAVGQTLLQVLYTE